jgi:hypothetical protein
MSSNSIQFAFNADYFIEHTNLTNGPRSTTEKHADCAQGEIIKGYFDSEAVSRQPTEESGKVCSSLLISVDRSPISLFADVSQEVKSWNVMFINDSAQEGSRANRTKSSQATSSYVPHLCLI